MASSNRTTDTARLYANPAWVNRERVMRELAQQAQLPNALLQSGIGGPPLSEYQLPPMVQQPPVPLRPGTVYAPVSSEYHERYALVANLVAGLPDDYRHDVALDFAARLRGHPSYNESVFLGMLGIEPPHPQRVKGEPPSMTWKEVLAFCPCAHRHDVLKKLKTRFADYRTRAFTVPDLFEAGLGVYEARWSIDRLLDKQDAETIRRTRLLQADCAAVMAGPKTPLIGVDCIDAARRFARGEISRSAMNARSGRFANVVHAADHTADAAQILLACSPSMNAGTYAPESFFETRMVLWFSDQEPEDWPIGRSA